MLDSSADEGMVVQPILFTGTHTGSFWGLPPTNRQVRFSGLEINRMVDGKVAEHWFQMDAMTLFEQLGLRIVPGPRLLPRLLASPSPGWYAAVAARPPCRPQPERSCSRAELNSPSGSAAASARQRRGCRVAIRVRRMAWRRSS